MVESRFDVRPEGKTAADVIKPRVERHLASRRYLLDGPGNFSSIATVGSFTGVAPITSYQGIATVGSFSSIATVSTTSSIAQVTTFSRTSTNAYKEISRPTGLERLEYDRNGNLIRDGERAFVYDAFNRLFRVVTPSTETIYSYDVSGRRFRADTAPLASSSSTAPVASHVRVDFAYEDLRCVEETTTGGPRDGQTRSYVYGAALDEILVTHVAAVGTATVTYFHHEDVSGSTVALTDAQGAIVDEVAYDEWGAPYYKDAASHRAIGNPHLFQGHRLDEESGLYYLRARYYDPAKARFLQRDPMGVWGDPLNLGNPYTFAADNPLTRGDPLGLLTEVQLGRGFHSAEDELKAIRDARAETESSWLFAIGYSFSDPEYMRGVVREKELLGQKEDMQAQFFAVQNSWQWDAFQISFDLMQQFDPGVLDAVEVSRMTDADWTALAQTMLLNCFLDDTDVVAGVEGPNGEFERVMAPIDQVGPGDDVWATDPARGWSGWGKVRQVFRGETNHVAYLTLVPSRQQGRTERHSVGTSSEPSDGDEGEPSSGQFGPAQTIRCTPGHAWWVQGKGYCPAEWLAPGDPLLLDDGHEAVLLGVEIRAERAATYNLEVAGWHTYHVAQRGHHAAVLVHNTSTKLELQGQLFENAAQKHVRRSGETVITGTKIGKGGFDFLSFTGTGANAQLTINEVKNEKGVVSRGKFTALGEGRSGLATLQRNMRQAGIAIENANIDRPTKDRLLSQLRGQGGQVNVRIIGSEGKNTAVSPDVARSMQRNVRTVQRNMGAPSTVRLPGFSRRRIP